MTYNSQTVPRVIVASAAGVRRAYDGNLEVCCVRCGVWKTVAHFGLRYMRPQGEMRSQSWCNQCRAEGREVKP